MYVCMWQANLQPAVNRQPLFPRGGPEELASFMWWCGCLHVPNSTTCDVQWHLILPNPITRTDELTPLRSRNVLIVLNSVNKCMHTTLNSKLFSIGALVPSINAQDTMRTPTSERQAKVRRINNIQTTMVFAVCAHTHIHILKIIIMKISCWPRLASS